MEHMSILVVSCDRYSDLWGIFCRLFKKYWPDCPYKKYFGSNHKRVNVDGFIPICVGDDISWADNLKAMLDKIDSPYVLMLIEDFFLDRRVKTDKVEKLLRFARKHEVDCIRLRPNPPAFRTINKELDIGFIGYGEPYYVSSQPAIWKKETLYALLKDGYSIWDFELKNSAESNGYKYKFLCTNKRVISHRNGVERGKYYRSVIHFLKKNQIPVQLHGRGTIHDTTPFFVVRRLYRRLKEFVYIKLGRFEKK